MKIKHKLMISYLILIVFAVSVLGFLIAKKSNDAVLSEVNEKSKSLTQSINTTLRVRNELLKKKSYGDSNYASTLLNNLDDIKVDYNNSVEVGRFKLPVLYEGNQRLSLDYTVVDKLKKSTGTVASVFMLKDDKLIRVSTTIIKNHKRIVGTYIASDSIEYKKIINKQEYIGNILIEGNGYVTRMRPLLDKNRKVVGAIGIGNRILSSYLEKTLSSIRLGKTGYIYILDSKGNIITHPDEIGRNVSTYGFVKKMHLAKSGTIKYTYGGVKKVCYYEYFAPWHWYVVSTANYDELTASSRSILLTTIITGVLIILLGGIVALSITNTLVKPINRLKSCMELAGKGNLTIRCDIDNKDEIGILANSFNEMLVENRRLLEETVQYDKLKTEFIANMSHELRTPLNIIFSTAQLFNVFIDKGENLDVDKLRKHTGSIKQNCYRLLRLVNNLIDMTKIDSGFMNLELMNQNIVQVAEEITQSTAEYAQNMQRTIIFDTDEEERIMAFDAEKLERILLNLISNAIKFTEQGDMIYVSLFNEEKSIIISVKDTGLGIPEDKLPQLFQRFKQVDPLLCRSHEGSGIGLSIVKALVEMHQGSIEVKSKYGEGTEFIICIPVTLVPEENIEEAKNSYTNNSNVEKINIEFSDIYS